MKKVLRLTERDLHKIIKESVKKILNEETFMDNHIADNIFDDFIQRGLYKRLQPNMFRDYIMKSYGLKPGEERIADMVAKKVEKYKIEAENEYGLTEAYEWWDEETYNPNYTGNDEEYEDDYDTNPLDISKRDREDRRI